LLSNLLKNALVYGVDDTPVNVVVTTGDRFVRKAKKSSALPNNAADQKAAQAYKRERGQQIIDKAQAALDKAEEEQACGGVARRNRSHRAEADSRRYRLAKATARLKAALKRARG
jgi:hypothetical protein